MNKHIEEELLEILESSMSAEKASQERYRRAGKLAKNPESVALFKKLEEEEKDHEEKLMEKYIEIKKSLGLKIIDKNYKKIKED